jgi:hypothetical protein
LVAGPAVAWRISDLGTPAANAHACTFRSFLGVSDLHSKVGSSRRSQFRRACDDTREIVARVSALGGWPSVGLAQLQVVRGLRGGTLLSGLCISYDD